METTNTVDPFTDLAESIVVYLENEKPYLNYDFAISDIYIAMKVPNMHVSYCINTLMNTRFSKIKAEYRVKHALSLLENGMSNTLTIEAIGEQSGFKTRSNFYAAFKEITGITPTEYVQNFNQE
jgi:AraC-like DNA-binding protein